MKKALLISAIASTMIMAGGDFEPVVEPVIEVPAPMIVTDSGAYVGLAYSLLGDTYTRTPNTGDPRSFDESINAFMLQAGYKINSYVAIEGRYWMAGELTVNNGTSDYTLQGPTAFGLYVKPMYPVTEAFDIYALLGYASMEHSSVKLNSGDGFSWGLGGSYEFTDNVSVFVDYVSIYDGDRAFSGVTKDISVDTVNFGVAYNF